MIEMTERPLKIALVHTGDQGGGAEASVLSLHRGLTRLGHNSRMYVGTKTTEEEGVHQIQRFRCFPGVLRTAQWAERRFGWQYLYHPWFRRLDRTLDADTDVIHFHSLWSGRLGYADVGGLPRLTRRFPALMTLRDMWMLTGHCAYPAIGCERWKRGCGSCPDLSIYPAVERDGTRFNWHRKLRAMRRSQVRIITVSNWLGEQVRQCPIFDGKDVFTVYNGINAEHFAPGSQGEARTDLGIDRAAFVVMMAGQTVEGVSVNHSGPVDDALNGMRASGTAVLPLIVGHSAERVAGLWDGGGGGGGDAGAKAVCVPYQTDPQHLAKCYRAADVTLVTSRWETFGRIAAESQMCGTPVVTYGTGGLTEVVCDGRTGFVVRTGDVPGLARAIRSLADDPGLKDGLGAAAHRWASEQFSNASVAEAYEAHYREMIRIHRQQPEKQVVACAGS